MNTARSKTPAGERSEPLARLYEQIRPAHLSPLWEVLSGLVTKEPLSRAVPARWQYETVRAPLLRAGELISAQDAERRVLILENPALTGESAITPRLYAGLQLVLPGEIARCHRHSQSALRFILEGSGAYTAVDGERAIMEPFDLILTPNWRWHDHGNPSPDPIIWLDGLDIPLVRSMESQFAERLDAEQHATTSGPGTNQRLYGRGLKPRERRGAGTQAVAGRLFHYPYSEWRESLRALSASGPPDPHRGHVLEFVDPLTGGAVMPTISAEVRLLPAGFEARAHRSTEGAIFVVVEGAGEVQVGAERFPLAARDIVVAPTWHELRFKARQELVLFGFSDRVVQEKLGLYREVLA